MARIRKVAFREQLPQREPEPHPIWSNLMSLLTVNFCYILFFLPSLICLYLFMMVGGGIFLAGALILLIPAGPAMAAVLDTGFQLVRQIQRAQRRGFFASYRANFSQGAAAMTALLPVLTLVFLPLLMPGKPVWITVCLLLGLYLVTGFSILTFSQIALISLPLKKILKNALLLPLGLGWQGVLAPALHVAALFILYRWISWAFLFFLVLGPAMLVTWTCMMLWDKLEKLLLK